MEWFNSLSPPAQATIVSAIVSAVVALVLAFVGPFSQRWLERLKGDLAKDLESEKAELNSILEKKKAALQADLARESAAAQGAIRRDVELLLGERASQREYEFEARKRLYLAIGPLRFQLLLACRECAGRILRYGTVERYDLSLTGYYGRHTLYRIVRPLAILEILERSVAFSDFAIDSNAQDLLRLRKSLASILSGDRILLKHPDMDWSCQAQHVFGGSLRKVANTLVYETETGKEAVMRFDEFDKSNALKDSETLHPFTSILPDFNPHRKPIFWLRLVAYGFACNEFINRTGTDLGFERRDFDAKTLLETCGDAYIITHLQKYTDTIAENSLILL